MRLHTHAFIATVATATWMATLTSPAHAGSADCGDLSTWTTSCHDEEAGVQYLMLDPRAVVDHLGLGDDVPVATAAAVVTAEGTDVALGIGDDHYLAWVVVHSDHSGAPGEATGDDAIEGLHAESASRAVHTASCLTDEGGDGFDGCGSEGEPVAEDPPPVDARRGGPIWRLVRNIKVLAGLETPCSHEITEACVKVSFTEPSFMDGPTSPPCTVSCTVDDCNFYEALVCDGSVVAGSLTYFSPGRQRNLQCDYSDCE